MVMLCSDKLYRISNIHIKNYIWRYYSMVIKGYSGPLSVAIEGKLRDHFEPTHLEVINESTMHNVPPNSESHLKVVLVSPKFTGIPLIKRHRNVNQVLAEEIENGVHALSMVTKTPEEWSKMDVVESSPACRGGFGK